MLRPLPLSALTLSLLATAACQPGSPTPVDIEHVVVSEQLLDVTATFDIDLTREDAVYYLEPGLDLTRLSVTCPSLASLTFPAYVTSRIRPTGVGYDPATQGLQLANAAVPRSSFPELTYRLRPDGEMCVQLCWDHGSGIELCNAGSGCAAE